MMEVKQYAMDRMIKISAGMASAVLVTLGVGLLIETIGKMAGIETLVLIGQVAKSLLAPALGAGVAYQLGGNTLVLFSAMIAATVGGAALQPTESGLVLVPGQPISALIAAAAAVWLGKRVLGKTKFDMMVVPVTAVLGGGIVGVGAAAVTTPLINSISASITASVNTSPIATSLVIALVFSVMLMSPASSAALAIALQLDPVASAAALIGCTAQFVGFTLMAYRQTDPGGLVASFFVTPKVQFPNVVKNPRVVMPPFIAAMISAPIATLVFSLEVPYEIAGLGLNSLIAPLNILAAQGMDAFLIFVGTGVVLPAVITLLLYKVTCLVGWTKFGDLALEVQ
ncbi:MULTISPECIES: PTS transporter subunit IIC [Exiguobacterium]|uniref:PTS transporter subunit IIC n=1 Tax=Exiguobacterium TaxID=33986 RepID=UPI000513CD2C|nr:MULTISPECIES: PTS sugar transporter subunit IIC [Exiguobacterium]KGI85832.1 membrane protein [Exiguobacterium mexicanum]